MIPRSCSFSLLVPCLINTPIAFEWSFNLITNKFQAIREGGRTKRIELSWYHSIAGLSFVGFCFVSFEKPCKIGEEEEFCVEELAKEKYFYSLDLFLFFGSLFILWISIYSFSRIR